MIAMDILIICNDGGEVKTVSFSELTAWADQHYDDRGRTSLVALHLEEALNAILDRRSINTALAAAAPDLLAALKRAYEDFSFDMSEEQLSLIETAISKAEGFL